MGEEIFDTGVIASGIPECVHKFDWQLPPNEQPGGEDALILDGVIVYDMFHRGASFGTELLQVNVGLQPNTEVAISVPVNCHFDEIGGGEPDDLEVRVAISNGEEQVLLLKDMVNREWTAIETTGVTNHDGSLSIRLRFIARWAHPRNFFIDDVQAIYLQEPTEPDPDDRLGDARVPYTRVYVRVNQNASEDEVISIAEWAFSHDEDGDGDDEVYKYTVGFSNDDAGIGVGLETKIVYEVGQEFDKAEIETWYLENYGVTDVRHIDYQGNPV
jgi:hypothetical protein